MMQRSKSLQSRRGWMLNHHAAGADIGRPLFTDKRAPVTFAETPTSYTPVRCVAALLSEHHFFFYCHKIIPEDVVTELEKEVCSCP